MSIGVAIERFVVDELLFGNSRTQIDPDASLLSSSILDSLSLLRLIIYLEEQFGVTIEDGEVIPDNFETINLITAFLERKQKVRC